jgi:hypothetical protein
MYYFDFAGNERELISSDADLSWSTMQRPVLTEPAALTQLPRAIRDTLTARGCRVLQRFRESTDNVLRGAFFGDEDGDWAILCVTSRTTDGIILAFPRAGGSPSELPQIGGAIPDVERLPDLTSPSQVFGCSPGIHRAEPDALRKLVSDGLILAEVTTDSLTKAERAQRVHDGIVNSDCDGVSNVYYWSGKRWVRFPGAD